MESLQISTHTSSSLDLLITVLTLDDSTESRTATPNEEQEEVHENEKSFHLFDYETPEDITFVVAESVTASSTEDAGSEIDEQYTFPVAPEKILKNAITRSLFKDGHDVIYFPHPHEELGRMPNKYLSMMKFKIHPCGPRVIRNAVVSAGFTISKASGWLGFWGKHWSVEKFKKLLPYQRLSHFPMSFEVGRKDKMYMNHIQMKERIGLSVELLKHFDFVPETYILPREHRQFETAFKISNITWIIKPPASARGIGIKVITKLSDVPKKQSIVVSKYISNPFLINQRKFDLRFYILVTNFDPLIIFVYRDGVVRFASQKFTFSNCVDIQ
jgi:tubulin polyglutamylase TTLL4